MIYLPSASIAAAMIGTILVFFCGTPFRVRPENKRQVLWTGVEKKPSRRDVVMDALMNLLSWLGLSMMVGGAAVQAYLAWPK